jgi:hypothetical protein
MICQGSGARRWKGVSGSTTLKLDSFEGRVTMICSHCGDQGPGRVLPLPRQVAPCRPNAPSASRWTLETVDEGGPELGAC